MNNTPNPESHIQNSGIAQTDSKSIVWNVDVIMSTLSSNPRYGGGTPLELIRMLLWTKQRSKQIRQMTHTFCPNCLISLGTIRHPLDPNVACFRLAKRRSQHELGRYAHRDCLIALLPGTRGSNFGRLGNVMSIHLAVAIFLPLHLLVRRCKFAERLWKR